MVLLIGGIVKLLPYIYGNFVSVNVVKDEKENGEMDYRMVYK